MHVLAMHWVMMVVPCAKKGVIKVACEHHEGSSLKNNYAAIMSTAGLLQDPLSSLASMKYWPTCMLYTPVPVLISCSVSAVVNLIVYFVSDVI